MSLVERLTPQGLLIAEHSSDAATIERQLKAIDDRLLLWPPDDITPYWRVYSRVSDWQPPVAVAAWMDTYGNPLPLSSGLIDEVNRLRPDAPNKGISVDEHNRRHEEQAERDMEERSRAVVEEHRPYVERGRVTMSRHRTSKRHWQRTSLPGKQED